MRAEIITIGDELLIGQTVDTNSAWLGRALNDIGIEVFQITTVSDTEEHILNALQDAEDRVDIILMTGGLGPTKDDITKHTLCKYFNTELEVDEDILSDLTSFFESRGREMLEVNRQQAYLPKAATTIPNTRGTASGMWFKKGGKHFFSMPGVPNEMKGIMKDHVLMIIQREFQTGTILHRNILTFGRGESYIADQAKSWEESLVAENIKIAYLPSFQEVKIRLSMSGEPMEIMQTKIQKKIDEFATEFESIIFGYDEDTLEGNIGEILTKNGWTLGVAESCTGGRIGHLITSISGSSNYFKGSLVTYSVESKVNILGLSSEFIEKNGVVSEAVAEEMAIAAKMKLNADVGLSTTGYSEPDPENGIEKGKVCIGISTPHGSSAKTFEFGRSRKNNIDMFSRLSLNLLREEILSINI